jgi:hypothetical protein
VVFTLAYAAELWQQPEDEALRTFEANFERLFRFMP